MIFKYYQIYNIDLGSVIQYKNILKLYKNIIKSKQMQDQDQQFQVLVTNSDYKKLQQNQSQNKQLLQKLKQSQNEIEQKNKKIKELQKSLYIRDSFIEYIMSESDYAFGEILDLNIIPIDIGQSLYQDVVTHEQNGISSIQIRDGMELYLQKNKRLFQRFNSVQDKFQQLKNKIALLQSRKPSRASIQSCQSSELNLKDVNLRTKQLANLTADLTELRGQLTSLQKHREQLQKQCEQLKNKNSKLQKQGEALNKKLEQHNQKNYVIKLLIDEYYTELQKNLDKIGGLSKREIGTVVANQMKGIKIYIDSLVLKASGCK